MPRIIVSFVLAALLAPPAFSQVAPPPDEKQTIGRAVPDVELIADDGRLFALSSLAGKPLVLSPIFTRCPHACIMITTNLRDGLLAIGRPGEDYHVLTLTFDPEDTLESLQEYRERLELPEGWLLARADTLALDSLLDAIDFNYNAFPGGGFTHANVAAVLTPDHRVSGYLDALVVEENDIRRALLTAVAPDSLVEKFKPVIGLVALVGFITVIVVLAVTKRRRPATT